MSRLEQSFHLFPDLNVDVMFGAVAATLWAQGKVKGIIETEGLISLSHWTNISSHLSPDLLLGKKSKLLFIFSRSGFLLLVP